MDFIDYRKKVGLNFSVKAFCAFSESIQIDNELPNNAFNNFCFNAGIKAQLVSKHHSKINKNLLEYIMYQTGNIIRLLITFSQGGKEHAC